MKQQWEAKSSIVQWDNRGEKQQDQHLHKSLQINTYLQMHRGMNLCSHCSSYSQDTIIPSDLGDLQEMKSITREKKKRGKKGKDCSGKIF